MFIPNESKVDTVKITMPFDGICSVEDRPFWGTLEITYCPAGVLLEWVAFEKELISIIWKTPCLIEDVPRFAFDLVKRVLGDNLAVTVICKANSNVHSPLTVTVAQEAVHAPDEGDYFEGGRHE